MANLPEKNITTVDKITSIPSNTNLYINANGEFRQATVDDVLKASPVIADSIANQYKNATGSPILLTDSSKGVAIDFEVKGRSTQTQYSGKNKLNCSGLSATTSNGVTFTPVYDDNGSLLYVNVNGTATATASFVLNSNMLFDVESYILNGCPSGGSSSTYKLDVLDTKGSILVVDSGNGVSFDVASAFTSQGVRIVVYGGVTANNLKFYPMLRLASVTDSTYEPYTNGASPNPSYPQAIKSNGNMGWFDGELLQGLYNSGVFVSNSKYVCSKNPILCDDGDIVKLAYGTIADTICFHFYDKDMNYMSYQYSKASSECEVTVPTGAKYTNFYLLEPNTSITPQTAKHICVTINDKYALIVDSKGKNLLDISKFSKISQENVTVKDNTITVASGNYVFGIKFSNEDVGLEVGKTYTFTAKSISGIQLGGYKLSYIDGTYDNVFMGTMGTATITKEVKDILFYISTPYTGTTDVVIGDMQIEENNKATDYEPYIKSRKYIPISAPLRGIGEVTDVASLTNGEVTRKSLKSVYDGTESGWSYFKAYNDYYIVSIPIPSNAKIASALCSHFIYTRAGVPNVGQFTIAVNRFVTFGFSADIATTLDEWKTWLQANPITVIYELAEPTIESIEPIEIVTYDNVTHISVSDNADMEIEYPTSKVAGIASIGWSKGRRAEYDLEQLKAQMLALQTTIVSTV